MFAKKIAESEIIFAEKGKYGATRVFNIDNRINIVEEMS